MAGQLESASVVAFEVLEEELRLLGAPEALLGWARQAREDEIHHASMRARLVRQWGLVPRPPLVPRQAPRPALPVALENTREGIVRETFGAVLCAYQ